MTDLEPTLRPFHQRATEAEERLSRLEAAINSKQDAGDEKSLKVIDDLQSKLKVANAELISEKEKAQILAVENEKHKYRIIHLLRTIKDLRSKLEQDTAQEQLQGLKLQGP
ncbi:uncharacterized protein LOC109806390 [Cajanus cajan]|uniref:uncharacterized protein LOC109806390 n=1 Tax=Cajanus cajan TaxID=3821 RepID=UPI00098D9364|nr:uncharacterized protein LOC109806390 [Cajanus cajan]